jgi:hypothetical protein
VGGYYFEPAVVVAVAVVVVVLHQFLSFLLN